MPHRKRSKKQGKRNWTPSSSEQSQVQETQRQPQLQETGKQHVCSNSNATDVPCDDVDSNPLKRPQTYLPNSSLTQRHATHLETHGRISLDKSTEEIQNRDTNQSVMKDAQQINDKTATQVDDESLLNIIESADPRQALQLLEGNNHFTQDGLDRALISACRHGLKYLVQTLVRLGANVQFKDTQGNTPLLICAENGFADIVQFLLKRKADVNAFNSVGDTALILSIRAAGSSEMVRVLLDQEGIDISHQNQDGYTALMKAVEVRDVDVIKILMERHNKVEVDKASRQVCYPNLISLNAVNFNGMTAEQIADKSGLGDIYHILQTHLRNGVSPLVKAVEEHDLKSLQMLLDCNFVMKEEIQEAFISLFGQCDLKEVKTFTEKDVSITKRLLECGAEVTSWYSSSNSLSVAVEMGDYDLVELLCQHLGQRQLGDRCTFDAMVAAATSGRCDLINLLLKYKADINGSYNYIGSPLNCAFSHGHLESAKLLIQCGAKMDIKSALHSAVARQLPESMKFVFENYQPEVINFFTEARNELNSLLVLAAHGGNLEIIGRLLDAGADVNQKTSFDRTPLGESKDANVAKFLISRGANVNPILHIGDNLLLQMLRDRILQDEGFMDVLKVVLENGASVNESDNNDRTPLMVVAQRQNSSGVLQILLDYGADINVQDKLGNTALMEAAHAGCPFNVSCLLGFDKEKNLCLNVQNHEGRTALMYAANGSSLKIVEQLINCTADVNVRDVDGNTALLHAVTYRKMDPETEILTALIKSGSDVNSQNNDGFSPLMLATTRNFWKNAILVLLDSGADVNAVSTKDNTKTAVSFLPDWMYHGPDFTFCLQAFLKKGASLSYIHPAFLYKMIIDSDIDSIPKLIQGGVGPADIETKGAILDIVESKATPTVSPLCMALWVGNVSLARYFVGNLFLTNSDITSMTGNKLLRGFLEKEQLQDCVTFLDELSSQPWSLFQLAFVAVSSAVGSSPGRENRVNLLPLPQFMKDKLLFKSLEEQFSAATRDIYSLEQEQIENNYDWFFPDNISSHDDIDSDYNVYYGSDID